MRGSNFIFDLIQQLYYKCHKVNFKRHGSYIGSFKQVKNKKKTINLNNEDNKWFQYAATVALNHEKIKKISQKISEIKPIINK